jgi:hypothetical protein
MVQSQSHALEARLLGEIGGINDRVRALRSKPHRDGAQIKALEGEARTKWEELRRLRAGPPSPDAGMPHGRGLRR